MRLFITVILEVSVKLSPLRNILCKKNTHLAIEQGLKLFHSKNQVPLSLCCIWQVHFVNFLYCCISGAIISFEKPFINEVFLCLVRRVLVMEYMDGIPILNLGDEIAKRGINPGGKIAAAAKQ